MANPTRISNWPSFLHAFVDVRRDVPFAYGTNDCCTFAADAVQLIYGVDPMADLRGTYATAREAKEAIGDLVEAIDERMTAAGFTRCPPEFAGVGDVVACFVDRRVCCGVHLGNVIAAPGKDKIQFHAHDVVTHGWRAD
jgi:hypothetical protein